MVLSGFWPSRFPGWNRSGFRFAVHSSSHSGTGRKNGLVQALPYFLRWRMLISKLTTPFWSRKAMSEMLRVR